MARRRLVSLSVSALAAGLLLAGNAGGARASGYHLRVLVTGAGVVRVGKGELRCATTCRRTFTLTANHVRLTETPARRWKAGGFYGCPAALGNTCQLRLPHRGLIRIAFYAPGSNENLVPLGAAARPNPGVGLAWSMSVISAQQEGDDLIVNLRAANLSAQVNWTFALADWIFTDQQGSSFGIGWCSPPDPNFLSAGGIANPYGSGAVAPGQTVSGNLCFPNDYFRGRIYALWVEPATEWPPPGPITPPAEQMPPGSTWFAVR